MDNNKEDTVYWMLLNHKIWHLYIAATNHGLLYVGSPGAPFEELAKWVEKKLPNHKLLEDKNVMKPYETELIEYLEGRRKEFALPMDFHGTDFQQAVWRKLVEIPYGQTATYTDIAERMNRPDAVRAVGTAIGANPMLITVPCHRLFGKHGEWRGYRGGLEMKERLLKLENIKNGKKINE
ncbi:methylated-DNA--[protein]-cysteine S-methyltransferase [Bacillus sp. EB600]|uniref:methylated-DNA--[protein]-cysteine S-methyltransferase n=1 Tax=Bacillus sp. EB600 TaxID=2806345 RepID=UPI00210BCAD4|nr:methylated-DNA--[protein]-cysteine S-methyltransferase [Bacillus sp. EB600]MCQ6281967.1 methylated-DNA--[protein]-cysteine S-methyltransferase [Bacillus sp. EB600]